MQNELTKQPTIEDLKATSGVPVEEALARLNAQTNGYGLLNMVGDFNKAVEIVRIAKVCHNVNKAYCLALGDTSVPTWEDAPAWQKESIIAGVKLHLNNPNASTDDSHNSWLAQKTAEGWKYGPVKDVEKKEHPCFVPYDMLPKEQQAKDFIFREIVHSLVAI